MHVCGMYVTGIFCKPLCQTCSMLPKNLSMGFKWQHMYMENNWWQK